MEKYEPLSESQSKIFNIKEIHKRYWKKFGSGAEVRG